MTYPAMIKRTLYFGNPAYLHCKNSQLVVELTEAKILPEKDRSKTIPIEDIGVVVIDHPQVVLTHYLIGELLENNVALITCDKRHLPQGMMLPIESNTIQQERFTNQINATEPLRKQLWQQTVRQKIRNQAALLKKQGKPNDNMLYWADSVKSGDTGNLEARAAAWYWNQLFDEPDDFTRDRDGDFPNNLLNYGYAILRAVIARALVASGLLPTLGIHHHNRYNAYCLADDIMEPYRPFIDRLVLALPATDESETITKEQKAKLLQVPVLDVTITGKRSPLMIAAQQTTASLVRCFAGEQRKIEYPEME